MLRLSAFLCSLCLWISSTVVLAADAPLWVVYEGKEGPGVGKQIVLVSGDEEYRSEECLPQLGKILAVRHGFTEGRFPGIETIGSGTGVDRSHPYSR